MHAQTRQPDQIVIIDDASSPDCQAALQVLLARYPSVEYFRLSSSMGANCARNFGIEKARGDLLAFLDDDDIWLAHYLESHIKQYQLYPEYAAQVCGYRILGSKTEEINNAKTVTEDSLRLGNMFCGMSGFTAKNSLMQSYRFDPELQNGQDWDLFVNMIVGGETIGNISEPLFEYRKNTPKGISDITRKMTVDKSDARLASAYKHRDWLGEYYFKKRVAEQLLTFLQHKPDKLRWFFKSIKIAGIRLTMMTILNKLWR